MSIATLKRICGYALLSLLAIPVFEARALQLSNSPLFVTTVLAPNVIISPAYLYDSNEVSLKTNPILDWGQCGSNPSYVEGCSVLTSPIWLEGPMFVNHSQPWRVVPWPNTTRVESTTNPGSYVAASTSSVYPSDWNESIMVPLNYSFPGYVWSPVRNWNYVEEPYPQPDLLFGSSTIASHIYEPAKAMWPRSQDNFLYFNEDVAGLNAGAGYQPWPALGRPAFPSYATTAAARHPIYNPIWNAVITADLDLDNVDNTGYITYGQQVSDAARFHNYIGRYWKLADNAKVWLTSSYSSVCWDRTNIAVAADCDADMTDGDKKNFATWFTYWRSSYLATRGILGQLVDKMGPSGADMLDRFRIGIMRKVDGVRTIDRLYSIDSASGASLAEKKASLVRSIGDVIYATSTNLQSAWDPAVTKTYFKQRAAYKDDPSVEASPVRSCRRNYEIILTPDYTWLQDNITINSSVATVRSLLIGDKAVGNADMDLGLGVPYADNKSNTLADVGADGWKRDLMIDLEDTLLPGARDNASWQHIVRYIVAPSSSGLVFPSTNYDQTSALAALANAHLETNTPPYISQAHATYDDLWHMALNSRGWFYPSSDVATTVNNLLGAFNDILVRNVSGSSVATNTTSLQSGSKIYQATVESDWKGHLRAYSLVTTGNVTTVSYSAPVWDLAESVSRNSDTTSEANARKVFTYVPGVGGAAFTWANLYPVIYSTATPTGIAPTGKSDTDVDATNKKFGERFIEYIRGDGQCEEGSGQTCSAGGSTFVFRRRNLDRSNLSPYSVSNPNGRNVLGDISNSNPWFNTRPLAGASDVDYPGYNAFRIANKTRTNVLFVGINDGMLHAIRTDDGVVNSQNVSGGTELFAYIPSFVLPNLPQLANTTYSHQYFSDGSPFTADACVGCTNGTGGTWKTVLASGANKGGKGYFLLDVTDPTNFSASSVLWEFTDNDMNYTYNQPVALPDSDPRAGQGRQIVQLNDGKWALIVGNGYPDGPVSGSNPARQACLFILYLSGPTGGTWTPNSDYRKYCAGLTSYANSGGIDTNGLSTPTPVDNNGDGRVDVVYAGDLNGNMWKFDISTVPAENDTVSWGVAYGGNPLFIAANTVGDVSHRQPIVAPPEVTTFSYGGKQGQLVLFGTGKLLEDADQTSTNVQSYYGVWDRNDAAFSNMTRSYLFPQELVQRTVSSVLTRKSLRQISIEYCTTSTLGECSTSNVTTPASGAEDSTGTIARKMGWYWDMGDATEHNKGERLTGHSNLLAGTVLFNTFYTDMESYDVTVGGTTTTKYRLDPCKYGGSGWIMALNAVNGYMEKDFAVFDVNRDGVIDGSDPKAAGVKVGAAIGGTTFARVSSTSKIGVYSPTNLGTNESEGNKMTMKVNINSSGTGRVSWFELME